MIFYDHLFYGHLSALDRSFLPPTPQAHQSGSVNMIYSHSGHLHCAGSMVMKVGAHCCVPR